MSEFHLDFLKRDAAKRDHLYVGYRSLIFREAPISDCWGRRGWKHHLGSWRCWGDSTPSPLRIEEESKLLSSERAPAFRIHEVTTAQKWPRQERQGEPRDAWPRPSCHFPSHTPLGKAWRLNLLVGVQPTWCHVCSQVQLRNSSRTVLLRKLGCPEWGTGLPNLVSGSPTPGVTAPAWTPCKTSTCSVRRQIGPHLPRDQRLRFPGIKQSHWASTGLGERLGFHDVENEN